MTKRIISLLVAIIMMFGVIAAGAVSAAAETEQEVTAGQETENSEGQADPPDQITQTDGSTEQEIPEQETPEQETPEQETPEQETPEQETPEQETPEHGSSDSAVAEQVTDASDSCIEMLKKEEGFSKKPYWDYSQWTVGYGTRCPEDMREYYSTYGITEAEAETLLRNHLEHIYRDLRKYIEKNSLTLNQNQFDALVLISYNCGTGWSFDEEGTLYKAVVNGETGNELIRAFARWCRAGGEVKTFLLRRRLSEANVYLNGVYSQTPPDNYCYVIYDANGGEVSPSSQGYDSNLTAVPNTEATYEGYTFVGWFTQAKGGEQVTVLDASTKNLTLYAHWVDAEGKEPEGTSVNVTVTVTDDDVNLRKGPGTNYTIVGSANTGDQFRITAVENGTGYTWGQFEGGWICLKYTDYDIVIQGGQDTPEPNEPEQNEPEQNEPEQNEPEQNEPEQNEPEQNEPEQNEPEQNEPEQNEPEAEKPVTGTVKADGGLCVRSGPSTGYTALRYLADGSRVEILEQKNLGSMVWGRIADGWISLKYVVLDAQEPEDTKPDDSKPDDGGSSGSGEQAPAPSVLKGAVQADGGLCVRGGPGTGYAALRYLPNGSKVEISEQKTQGSMTWGKISDGWICMNYVVLEKEQEPEKEPEKEPEQEPQQPQQPQTQSGVVKVDSYLRIRNGAGTSYAICGYLYNGNAVTITETKTVGNTVWGRIDRGWISMDYVVLNGSTGSGSSAPSAVTKTINTDCLRIRSQAGTSSSIVGYLYYGAKVTILETKTVNGSSWGRISNGWICMDYVK